MAVWSFGRPKPDVSFAQLHGELDRISAAILAGAPRRKGNRVEVGPISEWIVPDVRVGPRVLLGAVILAAAAGLTRLASGLLFGVTPLDPVAALRYE